MICSVSGYSYLSSTWWACLDGKTAIPASFQLQHTAGRGSVKKPIDPDQDNNRDNGRLIAGATPFDRLPHAKYRAAVLLRPEQKASLYSGHATLATDYHTVLRISIVWHSNSMGERS